MPVALEVHNPLARSHHGIYVKLSSQFPVETEIDKRGRAAPEQLKLMRITRDRCQR